MFTYSNPFRFVCGEIGRRQAGKIRLRPLELRGPDGPDSVSANVDRRRTTGPRLQNFTYARSAIRARGPLGGIADDSRNKAVPCPGPQIPSADLQRSDRPGRDGAHSAERLSERPDRAGLYAHRRSRRRQDHHGANHRAGAQLYQTRRRDRPDHRPHRVRRALPGTGSPSRW